MISTQAAVKMKVLQIGLVSWQKGIAETFRSVCLRFAQQNVNIKLLPLITKCRFKLTYCVKLNATLLEIKVWKEQL